VARGVIHHENAVTLRERFPIGEQARKPPGVHCLVHLRAFLVVVFDRQWRGDAEAHRMRRLPDDSDIFEGACRIHANGDSDAGLGTLERRSARLAGVPLQNIRLSGRQLVTECGLVHVYNEVWVHPHHFGPEHRHAPLPFDHVGGAARAVQVDVLDVVALLPPVHEAIGSGELDTGVVLARQLLGLLGKRQTGDGYVPAPKTPHTHKLIKWKRV